MKKIIAVTAILFMCFISSAQCLLKEVSLQQRSSQSNLIIEGKVVSKNSFWNEDRTMIYTSNRVEVFKVLKGSGTPAMIDIITEGGIVGMDKITTSSLLTLDVNETGIFLCEAVQRAKALPAAIAGIPRYEPYASKQGFIKYDVKEGTASDPFTRYDRVDNNLYKLFSPSLDYRVVKPFAINVVEQPQQRVQAITGFSPSTITAGTGSVLTITGTAFGATQGSGSVRFRNGDDGGATYITPLASQYVSWSNTQIQVQVPQNAATGTIQVIQGVTTTSGSALTITYAHLNVDFDPGPGTIAYQTDHINDNGSGGYTWRMNTGFDANTPARNSFMRAFDEWRCGTNVNWIIGATTSINDAVSDGTNVICFDNAAPLSPGILGVCYSYWSGCASGPNIVWYVNELDIIFDEGSNITPLTWEFGSSLPSGSEYDFETVAVHELGHGHQLGHVISPGAIMHFAISNGASNRTLGVNDLAGGTFVQSKSIVGNICGPGAMAAYTGCSTLPLSITSLKAYQYNNGIKVEWANTAESDVNYYEIEESVDGNHFTKATTLSPKNNNGSRTDYDWLDAQVINGMNYYRVKTTGINGRSEYSNIVSVKLGKDKQFNIYPNPVKGNNITIELNDIEQGVYTLSTYNASGQQVMNRSVVYNGNASQNVSLPSLATGVYRVTLKGNNVAIQQTLIVGK
ncbi:MAG TPA: T9SS type A sorting domain-containing protein [Chitinophagaceae bacterium]|jgi:hypothetical protein|nr:T9SS type A sorting domain-containing protein [Chitinophagaceae bacterium]